MLNEHPLFSYRFATESVKKNRPEMHFFERGINKGSIFAPSIDIAWRVSC